MRPPAFRSPSRAPSTTLALPGTSTGWAPAVRSLRLASADVSRAVDVLRMAVACYRERAADCATLPPDARTLIDAERWTADLEIEDLDNLARELRAAVGPLAGPGKE